MSLGKSFRHIWHSLLVGLKSKKIFELTDTCQNIVSSIDLGEENKNFKQKARFVFHLSMCQACANYYRFSNSLRTELKKPSHEGDSMKKTSLESLQARLVAEIVNAKSDVSKAAQKKND